MAALVMAGQLSSAMALTTPRAQAISIPSTSASNGSAFFRGFEGLSIRRDLSVSSSSIQSCPVPDKFGGLRLTVEAVDKTRREGVAVRHRRIRKKLSGTEERPRLAVFRSNQHIYAQVIDDTKDHTLAAASTVTPTLRAELQLTSGAHEEAAKRVGQEIARICLEKGITKVAFDRGGFVYHGRIAALADAARQGGLEF